MPRVTFDELPDHGRLWVFPANRDLTDAEARTFLGAVDSFLDGWAAHGVPLRSGRELREERFLLIGVDVDVELPSGCSIDSLVKRLRVLGGEMGVSLVDHAPVWFRRDGAVATLSRPEFKALARAGEVSDETQVFDTSLTSVGELRAGRFERSATQTWHGKAFFGSTAAS